MRITIIICSEDLAHLCSLLFNRLICLINTTTKVMFTVKRNNRDSQFYFVSSQSIFLSFSQGIKRQTNGQHQTLHGKMLQIVSTIQKEQKGFVWFKLQVSTHTLSSSVFFLCLLFVVSDFESPILIKICLTTLVNLINFSRSICKQCTVRFVSGLMLIKLTLASHFSRGQ